VDATTGGMSDPPDVVVEQPEACLAIDGSRWTAPGRIADGIGAAERPRALGREFVHHPVTSCRVHATSWPIHSARLSVFQRESAKFDHER
jgi:hypothetical protein